MKRNPEPRCDVPNEPTVLWVQERDMHQRTEPRAELGRIDRFDQPRAKQSAGTARLTRDTGAVLSSAPSINGADGQMVIPPRSKADQE